MSSPHPTQPLQHLAVLLKEKPSTAPSSTTRFGPPLPRGDYRGVVSTSISPNALLGKEE